MIEADRIKIEQKIQEKGTPKNLEKFRAIHSNDAGEPLSSVDFKLYEIVLEERGGVPASDAIEKTEMLKGKYEKGNEEEKNRIANVMLFTFEGLMSDRAIVPQPVRANVSETIVYQRR